MAVYRIDPETDARWRELLARHPQASPFHSPAWLGALRSCYGYEPLALTTSAPGAPLRSAIAFCVVKSWLTGTRLVSLPFSDHCQPLVESAAQWDELFGEARRQVEQAGWKYVEVKPLQPEPWWNTLKSQPVAQSATYFLHRLDLRPMIEALFARLHKDCIRRKLRRAEREGLRVESGRSTALLDAFYSLQLLTRRRFRLLPQPRRWFQALLAGFADNLTIRVAYLQDAPIAGILTLQSGKTAVYKYGCSDPRHHATGAVPLLMWQAICEARDRGALEFDFGRSDLDNPGLVAFKDHWGGTRTTLNYFRYPAEARDAAQSWSRTMAGHAAALLPDFCLAGIGRIAYRHAG